MQKLSAYSAAVAGRGWAYAASLFAGAASIAANIAHSFVPPVGAAADWQPMTGKIIESVLWPVFLFLAVEVMSRVAWPKGFWYGLLRYVATLPVAFVTALVSYTHASGLLTYYGEEHIVTVIGPIGIDGLMLGATAALIVTGKRRLSLVTEDMPASPAPATVPPVLGAMPAFTPFMPARGVTTTATPTAPAALDRQADLQERMASTAPSNASAAPAVEFSAKPRPAAETRRLWEELKAAEPLLTQEQGAQKLGIARRTLRDALEATEPNPANRRNPNETREMFLGLKAANPSLTHAQGADQLGMRREDLSKDLAATSAATVTAMEEATAA